MDNEATARLKFDRRLAQRRDWVDGEELDNELASLPDCADKIDDGGGEAAAAPEAPEFVAPPVAPAHREFGGGNPEA